MDNGIILGQHDQGSNARSPIHRLCTHKFHDRLCSRVLASQIPQIWGTLNLLGFSGKVRLPQSWGLGARNPGEKHNQPLINTGLYKPYFLSPSPIYCYASTKRWRLLPPLSFLPHQSPNKPIDGRSGLRCPSTPMDSGGRCDTKWCPSGFGRLTSSRAFSMSPCRFG